MRGRAEQVTLPKPRSGLRPRRKGVDGEDLGRGTIGVAMIDCGHGKAASVLVHRNVEPSIHMRCRITASLRATLKSGPGPLRHL